jgi:hypothetical protein
MAQVASRFSFLKDTGALDHHGTLLVGKSCLVLTVMLAFLAMSLSGMLAALVLGTAWFWALYGAFARPCAA